MKKSLSLLMAVILIFIVIGTVPTVFAEDIAYTFVNDTFIRTYWKEFLNNENSEQYERGVIKAGNWYYRYSKNLSTGIEYFDVCGYDGNEIEIQIPTQFNGKSISCIAEFYLFSTTVKTIKIPKEIQTLNYGTYFWESFDSSQWDDEDYIYNKTSIKPLFECTSGSQFEEIIVDSENPKFSSLDGVLFTKNYRRLIYFPAFKGKEYVVPSTVNFITKGAFIDARNLEILTITPEVQELGLDSIPKNGLKELRFENTILPQYSDAHDQPEDEGDPPLYIARYVPDVTNTVVYCVKDSELYKYYKSSFEEPDAMCKELKALSQLTETLIKESDGKWNYYCNDYKMYSSTLVKYSGKWFYVTNGVWDKTVTDKVVTYKNKSFYIKNGKWDSSVNTLTKKNGEWLGIVNGKCDNSVNTLIKYKGKWFYVKNGKWCKDTAIVKYKGKSFYVKKGKVDFDFSGKKKINGKTYKIKNGKVA